MDILLREKYNKEFRQVTFDKFVIDINQSTGNRLDFKICETPLFLTKELTNELINAGEEILAIIQTNEFLERLVEAIPPNLVVPNEDEHPIFLQIDFGITVDKN